MYIILTKSALRPECGIPIDDLDSGQHTISSVAMIFSEPRLSGVSRPKQTPAALLPSGCMSH